MNQTGWIASGWIAYGLVGTFMGTTILGGCLAAAMAVAGQKSANEKPDPASAGGQRLAEPATYENLTIFPVVSHLAPDTSAFETLDDALGAGDAVVTESGSDVMRRSRDGRPADFPRESSASVNQLVLINRGSRPLILLAGELVSGGKQDRIISKDRIVKPGSEPLPLDVFCVEHGRWSSGTQFSAAKIMVHPSVRESAAVDQEQDKVWNAVRSGTNSGNTAGISGSARAAVAAAPPPTLSAQALGGIAASSAPTQSYKGIYQSSQVDNSVEPFADEMQKRFVRVTANLKGEEVVGVVVVYGGEVAWSDVFASSALFQRYWPKLLRSYIVEALARPRTQEQASLDAARDFLTPLAGHENIETEPDVYRLRQVTQDHYVEIELEALHPSKLALHTLRIHRTS